LEAQVSRLTVETAVAQDLRSNIDFSIKTSAEYQSEVENNELKLRIAKMRNQRLEDQLTQLKRQLENKRQEANDKEKILEQLQLDITLLSGDFQRLLERTAQQRFSATQKDLDDDSQNFNEPRPFDHFEGSLGATWPPPGSSRPLPARESSSPPPRSPSPPPARPREPAALRDNISFGEPPPVAPIADSPQLTVSELREELDALSEEKAQLEWRVQRAPAPGVSVSQARRARAQLEGRLEEVDRRIGHIRLTLRQFGDA
jgi:chromosome segregation ATPase